MSQARSSRKTTKLGRPRSEAARQAILQSAKDILMAQGLGRLTVEAVAERAGVGKPTIYRYWRNAHELAMAAFLAEPEIEAELRADLTARQRLELLMERLVETFATIRGRQLTLTLAASDQESEIAKAFRTQVILKCREDVRAILIDAQRRSEVQLRSDIESILDVICAPIFYRLLAGHQPLSRAFGKDILETIFGGIGVSGK